MATENSIDRVLQNLFQHAWRQGAVAVQGRLEHSLVAALSRQYCVFRYFGPLCLIHSKDTGILSSVFSGQGLLTRLEGEWWMSFHEESYDDD